MDQPGKVANPARGQLNRENNIPPSPCVPENLECATVLKCRSYYLLTVGRIDVSYLNWRIYFPCSADHEQD